MWMPYSVRRTRLAPCWPGGLFSFSIGHLGVSQRVPLRKSFVARRRQMRHLAPVMRAILLDSPLLPGTAAVVRERSHVFNDADVEPRGLERADRAFPPRAGSLDLHFHFANAELLRLLGHALGRLLRGERRGLPRALVADRPGRRPAERVSRRIGDRDDRVVEGRLNVADRLRHELLDLADGGLLFLGLAFRGLGVLFLFFLLVGHDFSFGLSRRLGLFLSGDRLPRTLPRAGVRARP